MDGMIEEVVSSTPLTVRVFSPVARQLPDEVLASLEAVKAAQQAARERARRERWQAWAMVAGIAVAATLGVSIVRPRLRAGHTVAAATAAATARPAVAAEAAQQLPAAAEPARTGGAASPIGLLAAGVAELPSTKPPAALPGAARTGEAELDTCRDSYAGKRWRSAAEACAIAFASRPGDAKLALRVAEAQYARDHLTEAREWADRTLALDAKQADALAILAHSEQRTGDTEAAARAFRRYLALAPRGWHSAEARAVLRGERPHATPRAPLAAATPPTAPTPAIAPPAVGGGPTDTSGDAPLRPTGEGAPSAPAKAPGTGE
jgi:tetratricopeptide (TPR) repeat protein